MRMSDRDWYDRDEDDLPPWLETLLGWLLAIGLLLGMGLWLACNLIPA